MNIGQASKASRVSAKMIRYYESIGLIPPADRSEAGYRHYSDKDLHTLHFIRRGRDLGFSIEQIQQLLALWRDRERASADVKEVALAHAEAMEAKVAELLAMSRTLCQLAQSCHGDHRPDCPILEDLSAGTEAPMVEPRKGRSASPGGVLRGLSGLRRA